MTSGDPFVSDEVLVLREKASDTYRHYMLVKGCAWLGLIYIFIAAVTRLIQLSDLPIAVVTFWLMYRSTLIRTELEGIGEQLEGHGALPVN